jgi:predicted Zn-dependent protease
MPIDPAALVGEVFKTGREVTRSLDRVLQASIQLDASDERELGRQLHEMLMNRLPMIHNPKLESQLAKLAEPFLRQRNRKDIDYSFSVIDDSQVNAFAHAGGYIYVNRGLLDFVANEDELRFVLGHEIAHVDLRHCVEQVTFAVRASELAGGLGASLVQIGYQAIALGYAEDREFEADARSYSLMGKGKPVAIAFLTKLAKLEPPRSDEVSNELIDVTLREIDGHFATHPSTQARITALQKLK